jgi:D-specific alpha-keto acid dehydrogenase
MSCSERTAGSSAGLARGITIYGCAQDEAALFRKMAPRFGVIPTIKAATVSEDNIELPRGTGASA